MRLMPLLLSGPVLLRPLVLPLAVAALAAGWSVPAAADVWAYVDARGESHFATEQLDERYELFFRSAESFDTRRDPPPSEPVAVPAASALATPLPSTTCARRRSATTSTTNCCRR